MTLTERHGNRNGDLLYSAWHRPNSMRRYMPPDIADEMMMINIDALARRERWIETRANTHEPLFLVETAFDTGLSDKPARATQRLAARAQLEAYVTLITPNDIRDDIIGFRVRQVNPCTGIWIKLTPQDYADLLLRARTRALRDTFGRDRELWP
jgi:hypothetical protein